VKPEHENYLKRCEKMSEIVEERFKYTDWKQLFTDEELGVYSWERVTE
jgi:hypothetical protein